ncbi:MAG: membrane protein insertion efficiency factor YidD [Clostridia bacterium]|nr:membrane protein insertion efficiency factor YidD [Clostridia bacterium]
MKQFLLRLLRFYRTKISPHKPPMCRYYPTCSEYAVEAIETHGAFFGSLLAIRRLLRCNVLFPGGYDPVPPKKNHHHTEDDP